MSLSVGLYVCLWAYLRNHMPKLQFSVYIAGGCGSFIFWQHWMFVNDIMFAHNQPGKGDT